MTENNAMLDNNDVTEIEEGVIEGTDPAEPTSSKEKTRLSVVSQKYDIDGDGVLDPAELAMRKLDKSGRGFLTNEKVYALMQEQLAMQKSMFQMKKIIAGLLAFVFILALANLGTSFASAILAKDTTTSNGQLVDKNTNEVVATASAVNDYAVGEDDGDYARALQGNSNACTGDVNTTTADCDTIATINALGTSTMTATAARAMLQDCFNNKNVVLHSKSTTGDIETTKSICGSTGCGGSTFRRTTGQLTFGHLCIQGSTTEKLIVEKEKGSDPEVYTLNVCPIVAPTNFETCVAQSDCGYEPLTACDGTLDYGKRCSCSDDGTEYVCYYIDPKPCDECTQNSDCIGQEICGRPSCAGEVPLTCNANHDASCTIT